MKKKLAAMQLFKDGRFEQLPLTFPTETLQLFPGEGEEESARFVGVASVFGSIVDTYPNRTKFQRGAFSKTIADRANRIKILSNHNDFAPAIGLPIRLEETLEGLLVEASLNKTALGMDAAAMIRHAKEQNRLDALELSVGFDAINWVMEEDPDTKEMFRIITEARLWEISFVNFGADRNTRILEAARLSAGSEGLIEILDQLVEQLGESSPSETFEGKMLSKKNKQKVAAAIAALQALLEAAEPPEKDSLALTDEEMRDIDIYLIETAVRFPWIEEGASAK
jgi:HK97 family phage prohead protease